MEPPPKSLFRRWLVNTLAVMIAVNVVDGIECHGFIALIATALVLGIVNTLLRPILLLLSLPLVVVTLGLFILVINAALLYVVDWLVKPFSVANFRAAFWGALVISLVSWILNLLLDPEKHPPPAAPNQRSRDSDDSGGGPVIDV